MNQPVSKTSRTYKSSNTKVATVSSAGKVTIKGVGTCKITISAKQTDYYESAVKTLTIKAVPKKPSISKITAMKRSMAIKMASKVSSTKGTTYQVSYRAKGTSKWTYKKTKNQSLTISKLKKGKKYQVRVRSLKPVNGRGYYSAWSYVKTSGTIR